VDNAVGVGVLHRPGQDFHQERGLAGGQRCAGQLGGQAASLQELQGEEGDAVVLAHLINLHDIGVPQAGDRLGFAAEAPQLLRGGMAAGQHHFEGYRAFQGEVARLVDHAHAAVAQDALDLIAGDVRKLIRGPGFETRVVVLGSLRVEHRGRSLDPKESSPLGWVPGECWLRLLDFQGIQGVWLFLRRWLRHGTPAWLEPGGDRAFPGMRDPGGYYRRHSSGHKRFPKPATASSVEKGEPARVWSASSNYAVTARGSSGSW